MTSQTHPHLHCNIIRFMHCIYSRTPYYELNSNNDQKCARIAEYISLHEDAVQCKRLQGVSILIGKCNTACFASVTAWLCTSLFDQHQ